MRELILLVDWNDRQAGELVAVDYATALRLIRDGIACEQHSLVKSESH